MKNFLQRVISLKRKEVDASRLKMPITHFVDSGRLLKGVRSFAEGLSRGGRVNLIAEIKRRSPSRKKGFREKIDVAQIAGIYGKNGARAISVVTDKRFFGGDISYIGMVKQSVGLPVLRKDFIVDEYQVYESRYHGADAILLIARILSKKEIKGFVHLAETIGMDSIVEVHDEGELERALAADVRIIGINNRDLDTFKVSLSTTFRLLPRIPKEIIRISESGIKTSEDIARLRTAGVNAVLIGEAFLAVPDIEGKIKQIMGNKGA